MGPKTKRWLNGLWHGAIHGAGGALCGIAIGLKWWQYLALLGTNVATGVGLYIQTHPLPDEISDEEPDGRH